MGSKPFTPYYAECDCGEVFYRDKHWKTLCIDCWKQAKREEESFGWKQQQQKEIIKVVTVQAPPIELDMIRRLLQLAHPDRHNNSAAANEATRYLLELKRAAQAG